MMNCQQVRQLLHAYADGELDLVHCVDIEQHLSQCSECSVRAQGLKTLKATITNHATYFRAPRELCVVNQSTDVPSKRRRRLFAGILAQSLALSLLIGAICFSGGLLINSRQHDRRLADVVVAAHVRSLLVEHAVDVASSDRHTVKPWFQGKLDYAPQVVDLSNKGFRLYGGRLDYLIDRPISAIFYYRRSHAINVFIWPASTDKEMPTRKTASQGFHLRDWQHSGMTFWVISDLNDAELDQFVELLQNNLHQDVGNDPPRDNPIR